MCSRHARAVAALVFVSLVAIAPSSFFSLARASDSNEIPVLGLDENGSPVQAVVSSSSYAAKISRALESVNASSLQVLRGRDGATPGWHVRTVVVGIGATAEFGLPVVVKLGVTPRFRVAFSNSSDPVLP